jgi:Na+-transporting NADH:ubiquinone oxidoreductase subunit NqrB
MNKAVDIFLGLTIALISSILTKTVLMSLGSQYDLDFFANLTWKQYWGASCVGSLYVAYVAVSKETDSSETENGFNFTLNSIMYVLAVLFIWGFGSLVNYIFF